MPDIGFLRREGSSDAPTTDGELLSLVDRVLAARLPESWTFETETEPIAGPELRPDAIVMVSAPDGASCWLVIEIRRNLDSVRDTRRAADRLGGYVQALKDRGIEAYGVLAAPYVSPSGRHLLEDRGFGFVDATGNILMACDRPAMFIERAGSDRDPWPRSSGLQSLKGPAAGAAVRAVADFVPPYGIRELAGWAGVSAPTLSRVVDILEREGLVERKPRGPVEHLDWEGTIRRWTVDYGVTESNRVARYLEPRGLKALAGTLVESDGRHAVTGSMGLPDEVSVAPVRLAMIYAPNGADLASDLGLRPADEGTNVLLLEPFGDVVFARTSRRRELVGVGCSQLAADLLTAPGRGPTEGDELLTWMRDNEDAWRTRP